ncbi:MAG: cysteine--tRNA ligase [Polyangiales bacterium]
MPLLLKNTYTKSLEPFEPLDPQRQVVTFYSCGPTVYSYAHIGNFRSFLFADVLRRVLERRGYRVKHVMNITDVGHMTVDHVADASGEDKLSKAARELGTDPYTVARHYEKAFVEDARALRIKNQLGAEADDPSLHPRATTHVPEMLALLQQLIERGHAYVDSVGQAYFEVASFPEYGSLSGKVIDELEAGARVAVREEKKDPRDFALWKVDEKHLMAWDPHSPEGWPAGDWERYRKLAPNGVDARLKKGFPGWHIECSAMARAHLGDVIDIHTGGEDNIFPHHECEIAQSYGALGTTTSAPAGASDAGAQRKSFSRYWVHGRHLLVDGRKMSKRDGTFFTLRDLLDARAAGRDDLAAKLEPLGFTNGRVPANILRYALISNRYTEPMNFGFDLLAQARASVERVQNRFDRLRESAGDGEPSAEVVALVEKGLTAFDRALDDNLNMPEALAALFELVGALNQRSLSPADARVSLHALEQFDSVLDVLDREVNSGIVTLDALASAPVDSAPPEGPLDAAGIEQLIAARHAAKKARDFAAADALRVRLQRAGVTIEDTAQGVRWKRVGAR